MILDAAQNKRESINFLYPAKCTKLHRGLELGNPYDSRPLKLKILQHYLSFNVAHQKGGALDKCVSMKENLELFRCSFFMISYSGWQDMDGNVNTHCFLQWAHDTDFSLTVFLKRRCCTCMWWKLKRSAALPNNPWHNTAWMSGARKQTFTKCKSRTCARQGNMLLKSIWLQMPKLLAFINSRKNSQYF